MKIQVDGTEEIELGYFLAREYWGQGYATEAARCALKIGLDKFGYKRIISAINPANIPSIGVALRLGMIKEKTGSARVGENKWHCEVYSIRSSVVET